MVKYKFKAIAQNYFTKTMNNFVFSENDIILHLFDIKKRIKVVCTKKTVNRLQTKKSV